MTNGRRGVEEPASESAQSPGDAVEAPMVPTPAWPHLGYWVRVAVAVIAIVVALRLILLLQSVLLVLLASLVLALGLQPAIEYLEDRGLRRGSGLASIIVVTTLLLVGGALALVPTAVSQIEAVTETIPEFREELAEMGGLGEVAARQLEFENLIDGDEEVTRTVGTAAASVFSVLTVMILVPYFAYSLPRMKRWVLRLVRRDERPDLLRLVNDATERISGYILGNLAVSLVAGVVSFLGFWLMGLDYPLLLAVWVALTDLIPIVGAFIGAIPALALAARQGVGLVVAVAAFLTIYQLFENYLVTPRMMKRAIDLSPAAVIVAVMVGGTLVGVTGALLALPVAAMIKVAVEQYLISARLETVRADASGPLRPRRRGLSRPLP